MKIINIFLIFLSIIIYSEDSVKAVTMKQFDASLEMMRMACAPKFKVTTEILDNVRKGIFIENKELKCYMKCIAQMVGTLTKKGEINVEKTLAQTKLILPDELQEPAKNAFNSCKHIQQDYQDTCDKVFYVTKCVYEYDPKYFKFP